MKDETILANAGKALHGLRVHDATNVVSWEHHKPCFPLPCMVRTTGVSKEPNSRRGPRESGCSNKKKPTVRTNTEPSGRTIPPVHTASYPPGTGWLQLPCHRDRGLGKTQRGLVLAKLAALTRSQYANENTQVFLYQPGIFLHIRRGNSQEGRNEETTQDDIISWKKGKR